MRGDKLLANSPSSSHEYLKPTFHKLHMLLKVKSYERFSFIGIERKERRKFNNFITIRET